MSYTSVKKIKNKNDIKNNKEIVLVENRPDLDTADKKKKYLNTRYIKRKNRYLNIRQLDKLSRKRKRRKYRKNK